MRKTFKREVAVALLVWLVYLTEMKDESLVEILVWPVFSFAAAAFGFDQYAKLQQNTKLSHGGRPQRGSKYPVGKDKYPDLGDDK